MDIDKVSRVPVTEKMCKFTARINQNGHDVEIADVDFDMSKADYGEEKRFKLHLRQSVFHSNLNIKEKNTYLDIAIKAYKVDK